MRIEECKLHHISYTRGYVSVKDEEPYMPYKGRFGEGFKRLRHNSNSTSYCFVEYWIKEE